MDNLLYMNGTQHDFSVTVRTNYNAEICEHIDEFYGYIARQLDKRFHVYYEEIKHLGGENDEDVPVLYGADNYISALLLTDAAKRYGLESDICGARTLPCSHICLASKPNGFIVDYDGTLMKCTLDFNSEENQIGRLSQDGIPVIDQQKHYLWLSTGAENSDDCKTCKLLPLCYGRQCVVGSLKSGKITACQREMNELMMQEHLRVYYSTAIEM